MPTPRTRIWQDHRGNVHLRCGEIVREYWCPPSGGYVRRVEAGRQSHHGSMVAERLEVTQFDYRALTATRGTLVAVVRREWRKWRDHDRVCLG